MVRVAICFACGVILSIQFDIVVPRGAIVLGSLAVVYVFICLFLKGNKLRISSGMVGLSVVVTAAVVYTSIRTERNESFHLAQVAASPDAWVGTTMGQPHFSKKSIRQLMIVRRARINGRWKEAKGRVILYIRNDSSSWDYGTLLLVHGTIGSIAPPRNPGEFDYQQYLAYQQIHHQCSVSFGDVRTIGITHSAFVIMLSDRLRRSALRVLGKFIQDPDERAIATALVLGASDSLSPQLQDAYKASGTTHILSVSGLHVGVIYVVIMFVFKPLRRFPWSKWTVGIVSIVVLWLYALVTGFSPSVLRAVAMFSFIASGRLFSREGNVYNTMATSALVLMLIDPFMVMSIGFQLSYLAVFGILYLQRPLYLFFEPQSIILDKVWQSASVSIAAQLATMPVCLFYFNQFPTYFLLANLIVVPLSSLALLAGIALVLASGWTWGAAFVATVLHYVILIMNNFVKMVVGLPGSVIDGLTVTELQCVMLMILIVMIIRLWQTRLFVYVVGIAFAVFVFAMAEWSSVVNVRRQNRLIVYSLRGSQVIDWIQGLRSASWTLSDTMMHPVKDACHRMMGVRAISTLIPRDSLPGVRFFLLGRTSVLLVNRNENFLWRIKKADVLIIGNNAIISPEDLHAMKCGRIILDGTNSMHYSTRILTQAKELGLWVWSTRDNGAAIIDL